MAAKATVTIDTDKEYKVTANLAKDIRQRKDLMAKLKPSLEVSSPEGVLLSANGNVDYREKKLLKTSLVVEMKDVLKKPISVDCEYCPRLTVRTNRVVLDLGCSAI